MFFRDGSAQDGKSDSGSLGGLAPAAAVATTIRTGKSRRDEGSTHIAPRIADGGIHPPAIFVVTHLGKAHFRALDPMDQPVPRRLGTGAFVVATGMKFRGIDARDPHPHLDGLPSQIAARASNVSPSTT